MTTGDQTDRRVRLVGFVDNRKLLRCTPASTPLRAGKNFHLNAITSHNVETQLY